MTTITPTTSGRHRRRRGLPRGTRADQGYVLILTALLMLPLLAITGLAVDLGAWYARAAAIQRAADAAALAGVVYLPDYGRASTVAADIASDNGFTTGVDGITVAISQVTGSTAQLQVTITDGSAAQFFSDPFTDNVTISRSSTAEYVKPVPMGSPKNFLGTGDTMSGSNQENFWLAMSGGCSSKEQGDLIATRTDANFTSTSNPPTGSNWASCTGGNTISNVNYSADGYFYAVELPQAISGNVTIQIYDPAFCDGSIPGDSTSNRDAFDTTYTMRDNSSFNPRATAVLRTTTYTPGGCNSGANTENQWVDFHTLTNPSAGIYFVQVQTPAGTTQAQMGSNGFGLRAKHTSGSFQPCTGVSGESGYAANCPNVYGVESMGVYASLNGTEPSFYMADIGPEHNNKTLEISLWDPGEGSTALEILDPTGAPVNFTWQVLCQDGSTAPCSGETGPNGGYGPATTDELSLVSSGTPYQPGPYRLSTSKYSDRHLKLSVDLPDDITAAYGGLTWWRIRYTVGSAPTDRTTWSVAVKGDPVRLVPNP
jgi:Flp pilus assembly protein TadG